MKTIGIAIVILTAASQAVAAEEVVDAVLAEVNGKPIMRYDMAVDTRESVEALNEKYKGEIPREELRKVLNDALRWRIERLLLLEEVENVLDERVKAKIAEEVDSLVKELIGQTGSLPTFQRELEKNGQTIESKKQQMREDMMIKYLIDEKVRKWITVSPAEIREYYRRHGTEFEHPEAVRFRQILIKVSEYEDRTRAKMATEGILEKVKKGEDFAEIARRQSQGPESVNGGLWDFIERGNLLRDVEDILFSLKAGQLSSVIETEKAYYILKCEENRPARTESFDEVQKKIERIIGEEKMQYNLIEYLSKLRGNARITIYSFEP